MALPKLCRPQTVQRRNGVPNSPQRLHLNTPCDSGCLVLPFFLVTLLAAMLFFLSLARSCWRIASRPRHWHSRGHSLPLIFVTLLSMNVSNSSSKLSEGPGESLAVGVHGSVGVAGSDVMSMTVVHSVKTRCHVLAETHAVRACVCKLSSRC